MNIKPVIIKFLFTGELLIRLIVSMNQYLDHKYNKNNSINVLSVTSRKKLTGHYTLKNSWNEKIQYHLDILHNE